MEKLLCNMAEPAIFLQTILRWIVLMLETYLRSMFLHACLSCSCLSSVHDGVVHEQQVGGVARRLQVNGGDAETTSAKLSKEELEVVLGRIGLPCVRDGEQLKHMTRDELSGLFEEEPSLDEVKQAFCVFDENSDGFIDATELQRVLSRLGFAEGCSSYADADACRSMIRRYDTNQDGKLDFMEFVRVMEISFC